MEPEKLPLGPTKDTITVNMGAGGVGDALLGAGAVLALHNDSPGSSITYRVHPDAIPFVRLFDAGYAGLRPQKHDNNRDEPPDRTDRQANLGYSLEVRGKAPIPRWERYARNIGASGWSLPQLRERNRISRVGRDYAGAVVLSPFSTWHNREYHIHAWMTIEKLLADRGYRVVVLDRRDSRFPDRHQAMKSEVVLDASAERVAGILLNAAAMVGNDSGISHLAGIMGCPTIALCGQTTGKDIYGAYPQVRVLQGKLDCNGCWWQSPYDGNRCDSCCANLQTILPVEVVREVDELSLPAIAGHRACVAAEKLGVIRDAIRETNSLLAGDAAEFGVWRGGSAKLIDHFLTGGCRLHLFDTFTGIPHDDPGGAHQTGSFGDTTEADVRAFLEGTRSVFHVGEFPSTVPTEELRFRFVHLDADTYTSTLAGCRYFGPRMVRGGVIVFDDYGWRETPGVQRAVHEAFGANWERRSEYQAMVRF